MCPYLNLQFFKSEVFPTNSKHSFGYGSYCSNTNPIFLRAHSSWSALIKVFPISAPFLLDSSTWSWRCLLLGDVAFRGKRVAKPPELCRVTIWCPALPAACGLPVTKSLHIPAKGSKVPHHRHGQRTLLQCSDHSQARLETQYSGTLVLKRLGT